SDFHADGCRLNAAGIRAVVEFVEGTAEGTAEALFLKMMFQAWQVAAVYLKAVLPTALDMPEDAALAARRIDALIVGVLTAVLPTALDMPEDAALAARRIDALIVGVLTVGPVGGMPTRYDFKRPVSLMQRLCCDELEMDEEMAATAKYEGVGLIISDSCLCAVSTEEEPQRPGGDWCDLAD
ncbi:unnamed protein product, partial [Symbiodinium sp. KB8]